MSKIHVLDPLISNKIAAGEVVEKPASVIKELVENAIDAGSKNITIDIKGGGKTYIRVSDDGHGIETDDMLTAFQRHATSKITDIEDIYKIQSLGFRGEALASIASVSHIELISKVDDQEFGEKLSLAGGKILSRESVGASKGTTIVMKDLFFNTPARLKFLKSDGAEQNAISSIVNKLALSHTSISFKYIINDRITFKTPGNGDLKDAVYEIFGKSVSSELIPFEMDDESGLKASGLLSTIHYNRGNRQLQVVFVNGRYVANKVVSESLELAYKGLMPLHRHPVCFIFLELNPETVDVNIHPSKTEIKFHNENQIKQVLYSALRKTINSYNQVPQESLKKVDVFSRPLPETKVESTSTESLTKASDEMISKPPSEKTVVKKETSLANNLVRNSINTRKPTPVSSVERVSEKTESPLDILYKPVHEEADPSKMILERPPQEAEISKQYTSNSTQKPKTKIADPPKGNQYSIKDVLVRDSIDNTETKAEYLPDGQSVYDDLTYVGQAFATYLLFQKEKQLYFIDQHAAHEKIMYEAFREKYKKRQMEAQMLLDPITLSMTYNEQEMLLNNLDAFSRLGFDIEAFGVNDIIIRSVPILFDRPAGKEFIEEIMDQIGDYSDLSSLQDERIIMQSCKAAIKAHQRVDQLEREQMLKDLRNLEDPYTCPHGRPIIIAIHEYEIERKFKRS